MKDALDGMKDTYFDEFRRSEMIYNMRDITDHLTTVHLLICSDVDAMVCGGRDEDL